MALDIDVVWHEGTSDDDNRSHYGNCTLLNETFDFTSDFNFIHRNTMMELPLESKGAIVIIHGGHQTGQEQQIRRELAVLKWVLLVVIGDEESTFDSQSLLAPNRLLWQQSPMPGKHDFAKRFLLIGYPPDTKRLMPANPIKKLNWFFSGQVTHVRRGQCVAALKSCHNGLLFESQGFQQGLSREEYIQHMAEARVIPCPSGPATPDTFRFAEALEMGCIPIVDDRPGLRHSYPMGFWKYVLKQAPPFLVIPHWNQLPVCMANELSQWPTKSRNLHEWWKNYKLSMQDWLREDLEALRRFE